jgi:hypothetical protein
MPVITKMFSATIAVVAFSAPALISPASAQPANGGLYAFHTGAVVGGCPGLDWHITVGKDQSLTGFVAWDQAKHMARVEGTIKKDGAFEMDAQEVGGQGRKATVKGTATGNNINVVISGSGTACDGMNLSIPRAVGGLGGGGG